jgi:hypothetical protein
VLGEREERKVTVRDLWRLAGDEEDAVGCGMLSSARRSPLAASLVLLAAACGESSDGGPPGVGGAATGGQGGSGAAGGESGGAGHGGNPEGGGGFGGSGASTSLRFTENAPSEHDHGLAVILPPGFGEGELTLEMWLKPDDTYPVGPVAGGRDQLVNWSDVDEEPYSSGSWWFSGNFLLDGHNNAAFAEGTFSVQLYGGGRVRWLLGDGGAPGPGDLWAVQASPATATPSLLDGSWHHVALVRRWSGGADADLELWVDTALVATETSDQRSDLRAWLDGWPGFPADQEGWFWGAEKQSCVGVLTQYEDYKGLLAELRFWTVARTGAEIAADAPRALSGSEAGLAGYYRMAEGSGDETCDVLDASRCIALVDMKPGFWADEGPPLTR